MKLQSTTETRRRSALQLLGSPARQLLTRSPTRALVAVGGAAAAAGIALRTWVLASPMGVIDSDEAIVGMMARHVLDGEFTVFFWGQAYGGSQEALLTAVAFALFGSGALTLKLVSVLLYVVATVFVWLIGRRMLGERGAVFAAALFWIWPPFLVYWSTKSRGFYGIGLVLELVVLFLVLRLRERDSRLDAVALGLTLGLGWWATMEIALVAVPCLAWLVWSRPAVLRLASLAVPAFVAGAGPWIVWNATNGWKSLYARPDVLETSYLDRLGDFFWIVLPTWLGLRVPFSREWLAGPVVGIGALVLVFAGLAFLLIRRPPALGPLLLVCVTFPFVYAISTFAYYVVEPRYLVLLAPVPALLFGWLASQRLLLTGGLALALAVSVAGLVKMERWGLYKPRAPDIAVPSDISPLLELLERKGATRIRSDRWLVFRITFESDERLIASTDPPRYWPHERLVQATPFPAWVFLRGSRVEVEQRWRLEAQGYRRIVDGEFIAYIHPSQP